jgi:hypothetical protein
LLNLTVNQTFAAISVDMHFTQPFYAEASGQGFEGGNTVSYDVGSDSFRVSVNHGGVALDQTFAPGDIVVTPDTTITVYNKSGNFTFALWKPGADGLGLEYTTYGNWGDRRNSEVKTGFVVFGVRTPAGSVPKIGSASYTGSTVGFVVDRVRGRTSLLKGDAILIADFSTGKVTGELNNMQVRYNPPVAEPWKTIALDTTISGNTFAGTAREKDPVEPGALAGTVNGGFFGPAAQEIGGGWTVSGPGEIAIGTFAGKK